MSRISRLRSMTLTLSRLSRLFCCAGAELVVGDEDVEAGLGPRLGQLLGLALAHVPVGVDVAAVLPLRAHDVGAGRGRERGELGQAVVGGPARHRRRCRRRRGRPSRRAGRGRWSGGGSWRRQDTGRAVRAPAGRRSGSRRSIAAGSRSPRRRRGPRATGSRRNHVRWRRANWALRCGVELDGLLERELAVDAPPSSRGTRSPRRRGRPGSYRSRSAARLLDQARRRTGPGPGPRCAGGARPARARSCRPRTGAG